MEAAGKLIFSLLSIVFIAAGLFYELERWGVSGTCDRVLCLLVSQDAAAST